MHLNSSVKHLTQFFGAMAAVAGAIVLAMSIGRDPTIEQASAIRYSIAPKDPISANHRLLASPISEDGSKIVDFRIIDSRSLVLTVFSTAMAKAFPVTVQRPADVSKPRPTLYLLNGGGGGEDNTSWSTNTDVLSFLRDHDVNVVQPIGGAWSYYADWRAPDPHLGVNKWKTYLTQELPPLINGALGTDGVNAIGGLSTSGTSVLALAEASPPLYRSVASYSGCTQISDPVGHGFVQAAVERWGGGNTLNMYGPANDPMWAANDPYVHADLLHGLNVYVSSGTGLPGSYDTLDGPRALPGASGLSSQVIVGGVIEAGTNYCARNLQAKLEKLGIPATFDFPPTGTHSWGYWQDAFKRSWPVLARGLAIS